MDEGMPSLDYYAVASLDWPQESARIGEVLVFGGYPERQRLRDKIEVIQETYSVAGVPVTGAYDDRFTCNLDRSGWTTHKIRDDGKIALREWSGLSGSPVFCDRGNVGGMRPELVGFIKEHQPEFDQLVVSSASNLRADGTIYRTLRPRIS
jgi:hypothetical protein